MSLALRKQILGMLHRARASHLGGCFSVVDILRVLYDQVLSVDPANPDHPDRDRFILSKGHASAALYAVLASRGFFPVEWLEHYYQDGSPLMGHASHIVPGVEVSTGSLGHGLGLALGMALAGRNRYRAFAILSDGECNEGSTWEAIMLAGHLQLENLVAIVDYNKIQSFGTTAEVMNAEPFAQRWRSFGWEVREVDGHDDAQLLAAFQAPLTRPTCVLAHTIKGKGLSYAEGQLIWHYYSPDAQEYAQALAEMEASA